MDSLFLLNDAGSFLLEKRYRGNLSRGVCEPLLQQLQQHGSKALVTAPRITKSVDNCVLVHIQRDKLLLAAACTTEVEPLLLLEMLQQLYEVLSKCCCDGGPLTEEALRASYSRVYVLLDTAIDFGLPYILEENLLQLLIQPSNVVARALQLVQGSSRVLTSFAASIGFSGQQQQQQQQQGVLSAAPELTPGWGLGTGSGQGEGSGFSGSGSDHWWRRGGVAYASNEVYVDLVERLSGIVDCGGQMVNSCVSGKLMVNCRLSGIPELTLTVNHPEVLKDAAFHPSVRLQRFKRDGLLSLCPPDRDFCLATYWLNHRSFQLPISLSGGLHFPTTCMPAAAAKAAAAAGGEARSGRLSLRLSAHNPRGISSSSSKGGGVLRGVENTVVEVLLSSSIATATLTASAGAIRFVPSKQVVVWEVPSLAFDSPALTAEGTLGLAVDEASWKETICPQEAFVVARVDFLVKNWVPSGLKLESLDISCVPSKPYKGYRCGTVAGELEFRLGS